MKQLTACFILAFFITTHFAYAETAAPAPAAGTSSASAAPAATSTPLQIKKTEPAAEAPKPPVEVVKSIKSGNYLTRSVDRLGHGFGNVAYSVLEVPYRVGKEMEQTNPVSALVAGSVKGVAWFGLRLVAGAFEAATFFIPINPLIRDFDAGWFNM